MAKDKKERSEPARYFALGEEARQKVFEWWKELEVARGDRARLRRCTSPAEAALNLETISLGRKLGWATDEAVATVAGILSHVKSGENDSATLCQRLAQSETPGGSPRFSESRFRKLLTSRDGDEFYRNLRRAIQMLGGAVNPQRVADVVLAWHKQNRSAEPDKPGGGLTFKLSKEYYTVILESSK